MNEVNKKNIEYFDKFYANYNIVDNEDRWLDCFSEIVDNASGPVIDLGCGSGYDTGYLLNKKELVIACDGSLSALVSLKKNYPDVNTLMCFDMLESFPFSNNVTDLIIADLCLHYFTRDDTIKILKEMKRILINNGDVLLRVNSINDDNYDAGKGEEVEPHLYMTSDGRYKRFFDNRDIYELFNIFDIKYVREDMINRYGLIKKLYVVNLKNHK